MKYYNLGLILCCGILVASFAVVSFLDISPAPLQESGPTDIIFHPIEGENAVPGAVESREQYPEMTIITVKSGTGERKIKIQTDMILWVENLPRPIVRELCSEEHETQMSEHAADLQK